MGNRSSLDIRNRSVRAISLPFEADSIKSKVFQAVSCDPISGSRNQFSRSGPVVKNKKGIEWNTKYQLHII